MSLENSLFGIDAVREMTARAGKIFFLGIGGVSMSSLAEFMLLRGKAVSGSDRVASENTVRLEALGAQIFYRHSGENVAGSDMLVYTLAASPDNPEIEYAVKNGIPCVSRAEFMGALISLYKRKIGVSGTHGKSTVTAMLYDIFSDAGREPGVLCGAPLSRGHIQHDAGSGGIMIYEACEYKDSFLHFRPDIQLFLNLEMDHPDYFCDIDMLGGSFGKCASLAGDGIIYNADSETLVKYVSGAGKSRLSFSLHGNGDFNAESISHEGGRYSFRVVYRGSPESEISLGILGKHNIYNALAAYSAAVIEGISPASAAESLSGFSSPSRRLEFLGMRGKSKVYSDYAHHPSEIAAGISAVRDESGGGTAVIYQPHTFSRTSALFGGFVSALSLADRVIIADIYAARENNESGVTSESLCSAIGEKAVYLPSFSRIGEVLTGEEKAIIVMGAGDIEGIIPYLGMT